MSEFGKGWRWGSWMAAGVLAATLALPGDGITAARGDADGDKVADRSDNCPATFNPDQADRDKDAVGDLCDNCPTRFNPKQEDRNLDGVGDACEGAGKGHPRESSVCDPDDADCDGLLAGEDPCPDDPDNDSDTDGVCAGEGFVHKLGKRAGGDNCPQTFNVDQADVDGDGVGDVCDVCMETPDPTQADIDGDGVGDACDSVSVVLVYEPSASLGSEDYDNDGVPDTTDNCPGVGNSGQENDDQDAMGDACDPCPDDPANDVDGDHYCGIGVGNAALGMSDTTTDNCPEAFNLDQSADLDGDGTGDACDDDADGDGHLAIAAQGDDCDDTTDAFYPGSQVSGTSRPGDVYPNNCSDAPDVVAFYLSSETPDSAAWRPQNAAYGPVLFSRQLYDWLPVAAAGAGLSVEAQVLQSDGNGGYTTGVTMDSEDPLSVTLQAGGISQYAGAYTNDDGGALPSGCSASGDDMVGVDARSVSNTVSTVDVTQVCDYGAHLTLDVTGTVQSGFSIAKSGVRIPVDTDNDDLAQKWEDAYGDLEKTEDHDTQGIVQSVWGDGLDALSEYRGFIWGYTLMPGPVPPYVDPPSPPSPPGAAAAWVPDTGSGQAHFRTRPDHKDLFVAYTDFNNTDGPNDHCPVADTEVYASGAQPACPFAIGDAFTNLGIDVHVRDIDTQGDPSPAGAPKQDKNIQYVKVQNDTAKSGIGTITKKSTPRLWGWSLKGETGPGSGGVYGSNTKIFQWATDHYFEDRPYKEEALTPPNGAPWGTPGNPSPYGANERLDPVQLDPQSGCGGNPTSWKVEDQNDDGQVKTGGGPPPCSDNPNRKEDLDGGHDWDGDYLNIADWTGHAGTQQDLSPHDIDNDGSNTVELPVQLYVDSLATPVPSDVQYLRQQVIMHTITHEIAHAVGVPDTHLFDPRGVMYYLSNNWKRAGYFSFQADADIVLWNPPASPPY
jgi:hypothetical protein